MSDSKSPSPVLKVTTVEQWDNILDKAKEKDRPVIVDFSAEWCGPCKMMSPKYKQIAKENPDTVFLEVDVDEMNTVAQEFSIQAMPTFLALAGSGAILGKVVGADLKALQELVVKHAAPPLSKEEKARKAEKEGDELLAAGNYMHAAEKYSNAIELVPKSATIYAKRASAYLQQLKILHVKGLEDAEKATDLDKENGAGWLRKAQALLVSAVCDESCEDDIEARMEKRFKEVLEALEKATAYATGEDKETARQFVRDMVFRKNAMH